jgi:hypothetical protein
VTIVGTGNGIEHITVNKAQDGWCTSTFTGTATITLYPPSSVTVDNDGNVTIVGPPDANETPYTGKITQWFGGSFNKQNAVDHSTFHFDGTNETGQSFRVQDEAWTLGPTRTVAEQDIRQVPLLISHTERPASHRSRFPRRLADDSACRSLRRTTELRQRQPSCFEMTDARSADRRRNCGPHRICAHNNVPPTRRSEIPWWRCCGTR